MKTIAENEIEYFIIAAQIAIAFTRSKEISTIVMCKIKKKINRVT